MDEPNTLVPTTDPAVETDLPALGRGALAAAGLAGLTYWFAGLATFPDGPSVTTATAQQVRDHVSTAGSAIQGVAIAGMIGVAAALVFVAALVHQIRDRLPGSLLAEIVFGAGLLVSIYQWLTVTAEALLRLLPNLLDSADLAATDDRTVLDWYALTGFTHFMGDLAIVPMVMLITAFSLAARRGQLLPEWLVWVGLVIATAGIVGVVGILGEVAALYAFWFVALFGYFLWVLAVSVTCLVRLRRSRRVPVG